MKKRILSILLCLCMVACMLPTVAFAADTGKAIRLVNTNNPTGGILGYKNNNNSYDYIYMGSYNSSPVKWRVLDDQTNTGATGLFLLSEDLLGSGGHGDVYDVYFDGTSPYSNAWQGSDAQGWCNTFESSNLDSRELAAILSTTKSDEAFTSSTHNASFAASTNILNSDQVFFLSAQEAENGQYGFTDEAARVANYGAYASVWWLRSPFAKFTSSAGAVDGFGRVYDCGVGIVWAARPAFNLNLNSVLFTSAAVGGKPDGGLTAVPEYSGNEWKLTLLDSNRNFAVTEKTADGYPNDTITLNYSGATTGANEYISAIIADNNGAQYYGRVAQPTAESGTVEIKIPSDIAPGNYTLKVFSEQYNGDYKTDYASNFTDIALTVEKQVEEQFSLTPGGRYYFDLSAMDIPGTVNTGNIFGATSLPDTTLHYVPFTYAGTVNAYKLTTEMATTEEYAQKNKYPHSLFVADYAVTNDVSWDALNTADLIFGKNYASGGVDYTLRTPSAGSDCTGLDDSKRGVPKSNEWDTMLNKDSGYIQNWNGMFSWGQDVSSGGTSYRAVRGYFSARFWSDKLAANYSFPYVGFRPVLEVLNPDTLSPDGLKAVTLDLNGGKLGGSSEAIQIIVKSSESFTAPASDGLTRPDGDTDTYFMWLGSDGNLYAPGDRVPADVTALTVQWTAPTYAVTLNTNGGTINNGNVTGYTYGVGATLPTADDMTYTGYTFKGWYDNENLTGSPVTAIGGTETGNKEYWAKWEANTYPVTFYPTGGSSSSEDRDDPSGNAFITDRPNKDNPTTPTTAKSNSVKVDSKGNAVITRSIVADVISVAQSDSIKHGNTKNGIAVVVPVEISKALAGVQITLKADALDKLVSSGVKRFTIDTDSMADFGFMLDTLKELNRQTTGDLILKMKKTAVTSQEVETAIGNRPVYDITLWEVKNGKETAVNLSGKTVSIAIPYTPAKNEQPGNLYAVYVDENGNVQWISKSSYNMDQKAVIFVAEHFSIYGIGYKNQIPAFTDVNNHWAKDNMLFVVSRGLLSGTSATTFSPNTGMTRGMFVTALGRLAGVDPTDYQASMFTDVKEDAYYAPYVNWAAKTGVVSGTTDTAFAPDTNINREQMAVIMKNYATKLGYTIPKTLEAVTFADNAQISSWAKDAVKSMQQAGILAGKTNNCFDPAGTATRAEVATVLRRFVEIVIDPQTANGWVQNDSGEWSYYKNGDLVKGWLSNDQKWYWLDKNTGKMFSGGWKQIDGKQYYFYADGSMAVNTTVDGKTIGAYGARK